jgi:hypothetical protein
MLNDKIEINLMFKSEAIKNHANFESTQILIASFALSLSKQF